MITSERLRELVGHAATDAGGVALHTIAAAGDQAVDNHCAGHGVGLDLHEAPFMRSSAVWKFRKGMVVIVKPGLDCHGLGGCRIEDMVHLVPGGCERYPALSTSGRFHDQDGNPHQPHNSDRSHENHPLHSARLILAHDADPFGATGGNVRVEGTGADAYLTDWSQPGYRVEYHVKTSKPGKWSVQAEVAAPKAAKLTMTSGTASQTVDIPATGGGRAWKTIPMGTIELPAEEAVIDLKPVVDGWSPIELRKLTLTPAH